MKSSILAFVVLTFFVCVEATVYSISESLSGKSFLDAFIWQTIQDPTNGRVEYVSNATAQADGLYSVSEDTVILRADNNTVLSPSGPGRKSFSLKSNNQYSNHVVIFDIGHMPEGCGTWPAVWSVLRFEVGGDWPNKGEIDIVEGVNGKGPNQSTLHTSANCTMPSNRIMAGNSVSTDCSGGCGVQTNGDNSFGLSFNDKDGGWYAMERSPTHIAVYFWERNSLSVPSQVKTPGNTVDTSTWGRPSAYFPDTDCNFPSHFGPMNIVIDLTFCGDWAGGVYVADGCPSSCVDYVNNNPGAFSDSYFEFRSIKIYK